MKVVYLDLPINNSYPKCVIGLGYFDGLHLGHQELINKVIAISKQKNSLSAILTFDMPIRKLFNKDFYGEITPLNIKLDLLEKIGLDIVYVLRFNNEVASLEKNVFIDEILKKINVSSIVCGSDYRFGYKASGDPNLLKEYYDVNIVDFINDNGSKVSSSTIINLIKDGNIETVNRLLGRDYFIEGKVIKGLGNGKTKLLPTANIDYNGFVLPKNGVYKVRIYLLNKTYNGICNIGVHPTIDELNKPSLEVYIDNYDLDRDIYNELVRIYFIKFIREEKKFNSTEDLLKQIHIDLNN